MTPPAPEPSAATSAQLTAFYGLCFAAAAADGELDRDEIVKLYEIVDTSRLCAEDRARVQGFIISPPRVEECLVALSGHTEMAYSVGIGLLEVVMADNIVTPEEQQFIVHCFRTLGINRQQFEAMAHFVETAKRVAEQGLDDNTAERALKSAASGLAAVGIPMTAVYLSGSVLGLSAAGITSGLAALGLGFGMVPGIGTAVLLGTAVFVGVRTVLGDSKKKKETRVRCERERKAQLVIQNLQEAIAALFDRLAAVEGRVATMEQDNEELLELKSRLQQLHRVMAQRQASSGTR